MHVPEIIEVKENFDELKKQGLIKDWELPYENLLTRRTAAIFFLSPSDQEDDLDNVWNELSKYDNFSYRINDEKKLSELLYRITFSTEEKEKNLSKQEEVSENS